MVLVSQFPGLETNVNYNLDTKNPLQEAAVKMVFWYFFVNYDYLEFIKHSVFAGKIVILKAILMLHSFSAEALLQPFHSGFGEEAETKQDYFPGLKLVAELLRSGQTLWVNSEEEKWVTLGFLFLQK